MNDKKKEPDVPDVLFSMPKPEEKDPRIEGDDLLDLVDPSRLNDTEKAMVTCFKCVSVFGMYSPLKDIQDCKSYECKHYLARDNALKAIAPAKTAG